jgi:hypothetical protein
MTTGHKGTKLSLMRWYSIDEPKLRELILAGDGEKGKV